MYPCSPRSAIEENLRISFCLCVIGLTLITSGQSQAQSTEADKAAKKTTATINSSYFASDYDKAGSDFKATGLATTFALSHQISATWQLGGSLTRSTTHAEIKHNSGEKDLREWTPRIFGSWTNLRGLFITASAARSQTYFKSRRLSNNVSVETRSSSSNFVTDIEATQVIPIPSFGPSWFSSVGVGFARFFHTDSDYVDAVGGTTSRSNQRGNVGSISASLWHPMGQWTPFISSNAFLADHDVIPSSTTRRYLDYQAGINYEISPRAYITSSYRGVAGIKHFESHSISASLGYRF